jgi:hypothetical protein
MMCGMSSFVSKTVSDPSVTLIRLLLAKKLIP